MAEQVIVVGGGAAGLAASVAAARAGAAVTLFEAGNRVGKKLLRTGDGRCNFSNEHVSPSAYNVPAFVASLLDAWPCERVCGFFEGLGMLSVADAAGRRYPATGKANTVLDVLRLECAHLGVNVCCDAPVTDVVRLDPQRAGYEVLVADGSAMRADAVILACGDESALLARAGLARVKGHRALCPLKTDTAPIKGLNGIRVRCEASLLDSGSEVARERGELLFRDYGVSGIMVFDLSRHAEPGMVLAIDFFPDVGEGELLERLRTRLQRFGWREGRDFLTGAMLPQVAEAVRRSVGQRGAVSERDLPSLAHALKRFGLEVRGASYAQAQITCGGARTEQFDPATCQALQSPGLFVVGELLDVDGRCGGYNLHWAWASGLAAGQAAAEV